MLLAAAQFVYTNYLSKPYELAKNEVFQNVSLYPGAIVQRPNHGLAHTLRCVAYVPYVIDALNDSGQLTHCDGEVVLDVAMQCENIQLAMFFSVVGKESEASFQDDQKNHILFRKKSAEAYKSFVYAYQSKFPALRSLIDSGLDVYYGNLVENPHAVQQGAIHIVFRTVHNLDLERCYKPSEFEGVKQAILQDFSMVFGNLAESQVLAKKNAYALIEYAERCLVATGNINLTKGINYDPVLFIKCSLDVLSCVDKLAEVAPPVPELSIDLRYQQLSITSEPVKSPD
jgi:hypothetical protein